MMAVPCGFVLLVLQSTDSGSESGQANCSLAWPISQPSSIGRNATMLQLICSALQPPTRSLLLLPSSPSLPPVPSIKRLCCHLPFAYLRSAELGNLPCRRSSAGPSQTQDDVVRESKELDPENRLLRTVLSFACSRTRYKAVPFKRTLTAAGHRAT